MKTVFIISICLALASPTFARADGRADYNAHCAGCHGAHGNVQTEKARALHTSIKKLSLKTSTLDSTAMQATITNGRGTMPSFKRQLSQSQVSAIVAYIATFRKQ